MLNYKSAYELDLDEINLPLCLDMEYNQPNYDGDRQPDDESGQRTENQ